MTASPAAPSALSPSDPRTVGPYQPVGRLGQGGMGVVYLAQGQDGTPVALKVVKSEVADQPQFRARFAREVQAAQAVDGQYTARVVDADTTASPQWVATEYVPGPTLADHIDTHGPMPEAQARLLGLGLAEAVDAVHAAGLIHRDLKPSNVILSPTGPKVIDFGISQTSDATSLTQTGVYLGSLAWMSPEQVTGTPLTPASDMFSLGLLLAYAALGHHPYGDGRPEAIAFRMVNHAPDLTGLPPTLQGVCGQLLSTTPNERPTPDTFVTTLTGGATHIHDITRIMAGTWDASIVDSHPLAAPTPPAPLTAPPRRRRGRRAATIAAGATAIAAAAALTTGTLVGAGPDEPRASEPSLERTDAVVAQPKDEHDAAPVPHADSDPGSGTTHTSSDDAYPVIGAEPVPVRTAPFVFSQEIGQVPPGGSVVVECTTTGDPVAEDNQLLNAQWNYISSPVTGFVPDRYVDAGGQLVDRPSCRERVMDAAGSQPADYPLVRHTTVHAQPTFDAPAVAHLNSNDVVSVQCWTHGEAVAEDSGVANRQWDFVVWPAIGWVADRYVDVGGTTAPQAECVGDPEETASLLVTSIGLHYGDGPGPKQEWMDTNIATLQQEFPASWSPSADYSGGGYDVDEDRRLTKFWLVNRVAGMDALQRIRECDAWSDANRTGNQTYYGTVSEEFFDDPLAVDGPSAGDLWRSIDNVMPRICYP